MSEDRASDHNTPESRDMQLREQRVVNAVLQRIATAPTRQTPVETLIVARGRIDLATWRIPALAAAAVVMCVSELLILKADVQTPQETVAKRPDELPAPVRRYLETGQVAPMEWLNTYGGNR
ncbi:MAG: hypothetical protein ABI852_02360 [Gemmatimonadaceae bacterium]